MSKSLKSETEKKNILKMLENSSTPLKLEIDCKLCGVDHSTLIFPNKPFPNKNSDKACCGRCNIF